MVSQRLRGLPDTTPEDGLWNISQRCDQPGYKGTQCWAHWGGNFGIYQLEYEDPSLFSYSRMDVFIAEIEADRKEHMLHSNLSTQWDISPPPTHSPTIPKPLCYISHMMQSSPTSRTRWFQSDMKVCVLTFVERNCVAMIRDIIIIRLQVFYFLNIDIALLVYFLNGNFSLFSFIL